jgi:hypothetical protein
MKKFTQFALLILAMTFLTSSSCQDDTTDTVTPTTYATLLTGTYTDLTPTMKTTYYTFTGNDCDMKVGSDYVTISTYRIYSAATGKYSPAYRQGDINSVDTRNKNWTYNGSTKGIYKWTLATNSSLAGNTVMSLGSTSNPSPFNMNVGTILTIDADTRTVTIYGTVDNSLKSSFLTTLDY